MTRFQEMISTPSLKTENGPYRIGRVIATALAVILLICALSIIAFALAPREAAPDTTTQLNGTAAGAADRIVDGWALAAQQPEPAVVDGWALAAQQPEPAVVDGWALSGDDGD